MKKLKLTIAGEVMTFNLPENEEYKCEVVEHYVPKVGDCVRVSGYDLECATFLKIVSINNNGNIKSEHCVDLYKGKHTIDLDDFLFVEAINFTQITPEELKAKYVEAGYDWEYETNKVKKLKWTPKDGDRVWLLNSNFEPIKATFYENNKSLQTMLEKDLLFRTKVECQKFADHCMSYINNKKE